MTAESIIDLAMRPPRPTGFADWRARLDREHVAPVIAVAGSRGKTSVLRAVESIFRVGGYRLASWTDRGVEIEGERQRGELGPWSRSLTRLAAGGLDVALQELDWATVQTAGAPGTIYPIVAVANLCANSEACLLTSETMQAQRSLRLITERVARSGRLILNADDFALSEDAGDATNRYLLGISADSPVLRRHLLQGGNACWLEGGKIVIQEDMRQHPLVDAGNLHWTRDGRIPFAIQNSLIATAIALGCGLPDRLIAAGLASHEARPESMPGSFNIFDTGASTIVVDRPMPSWFLRSSLRAAANLGSGRQIRVAGPMAEIATDDMAEIGRLLGRNSGVLIVHGAWHADRLALLRHGAAGNKVPPIFLQVSDERAALQQAVNMLRPDDVLLVLAENPTATVRLIQRRLRHPAPCVSDLPGAIRAL